MCIEDVPVAGMQKGGEEDWIRRNGIGKEAGPRHGLQPQAVGDRLLQKMGACLSVLELTDTPPRNRPRNALRPRSCRACEDGVTQMEGRLPSGTWPNSMTFRGR